MKRRRQTAQGNRFRKKSTKAQVAKGAWEKKKNRRKIAARSRSKNRK